MRILTHFPFSNNIFHLKNISTLPFSTISNLYAIKRLQSARRDANTAVVRRSQKFSPRSRPLPGGAGQPKFNQLEMVTTFTYRLSLVKIEDRCAQFRVIVVTVPETHTHPPTNMPPTRQTGPITICCAAKLSTQCKNHRSSLGSFPLLSHL